MDNTYLTQVLPYLIRIAVLALIIFSVTDYLNRKKANLIVKALTESGADSAENALSLASLEAAYPKITKCKNLLDEFSSLRRIVLLAGEVGDDTKKKSIFSKKTRLTGEEKWYILPPPVVSEDDEEAEKAETPATPAILRLGGETSVGKVVFGAVVAVVFGEIIIYFLPQILSFFTDLNTLGKN